MLAEGDLRGIAFMVNLLFPSFFLFLVLLFRGGGGGGAGKED